VARVVTAPTLIGLFLIPSVLGVVLSFISLISLVFLSAGQGPTHPSRESGMIGGAPIIFGVIAFVGGLLGWLLVMKKRVLECNACRATVNAS
jgi:hypothetical protein